ncbi:MAG: helix-turn-helix domain-containing protein [Chloroflexi bacterium]|nr:helix-turn-helix domain-containing protein [Chloroflexota bacterium]
MRRNCVCALHQGCWQVMVAYARQQFHADRRSCVPDSPFDDYLDLVEAARELGIHPQSLRRLIKQKRVPAVLFAGKYLIERDKLEMFKANYDPRPGRKPLRRLI